MENDSYEIILDHLKTIRSDVDHIKARQAEHDKRFTHLERQVAAVRGDIAIMMLTQIDSRDDLYSLKERIKERVQRLIRHAGPSETIKQ